MKALALTDRILTQVDYQRKIGTEWKEIMMNVRCDKTRLQKALKKWRLDHGR